MTTAVAVSVAIAAVLAAGAAGTAGATTAGSGPASHGDGEAFVVDLRADGSADLVVRYTFDLADEDRRAAFGQLETNETARTAFRERFRDRIGSVVADAERATGREMAVTNASTDVRTAGSTGVAELSVTVDGLARTDGGEVALTEPFASGFSPDREFRVLTPESVVVESVTPQPDGRADGELYWAAGTELSGFALVAADSGDASDGGDGDDSATTGGSGPGFGAVAALAVLAGALIAALIGARRR